MNPGLLQKNDKVTREHRPFGRYQYLDVVFGDADFDTWVAHDLRPENVRDVRYVVVQKSQSGDVYDGEKEWQRGGMYLRASVAGAYRLRLFLEN